MTTSQEPERHGWGIELPRPHGSGMGDWTAHPSRHAARVRGTSRQALALPALALLALAVALLLGASRADAAVVVRTIDETVAVDGQRVLTIDISVGSVTVEAGAGDRVTVEAELQCSRLNRRCRTQAENLGLRVDQRTAAIAVDLRGYPRKSLGGLPQVDLRILAPPGIAVEVSMGVGEVAISGIEANVAIDLGVGDVRVRLDREVASRVMLDVGVGLAAIEPSGDVSRRSGFLLFGNEVRWRNGSGDAEVQVDLGVGQVHVSLE